MDDTRMTATNIFWKFITFVVLFFKTLVGFNDSPGTSGQTSSGFSSRGGGGGSGGSRPSGDSKGPRGFGPRGFKSVTDLPPPSGGCSGGACG